MQPGSDVAGFHHDTAEEGTPADHGYSHLPNPTVRSLASLTMRHEDPGRCIAIGGQRSDLLRGHPADPACMNG